MPKIIEKIRQAEKEQKKFFSLEFFPPRTDEGCHNLLARLDRMAQFGPLFVDVTWGAGGKTSERSLLISTGSQCIIGLETMMHLTCTDQTEESLREVLKTAKEAGIQNILALRGDAPTESDTWVAKDSSLRYAVDLVRFIRQEHGDHFGIAVAGYPYGHPESTSYEDDLGFLKEKIDAGADFIISQVFFDPGVFIKFERDCRALGITCPILPGVLPVQVYDSLRKLTKLAPNVPLPDHVRQKVEEIKQDDHAVRAYGIELCASICSTLLEHGCPGVHFYTLNLEEAVTRVLAKAQLVNEDASKHALPWKQVATVSKRAKEDVRPIFWANRQKSYLVRTKDWCEFPNGRWGDSRSPAFGDLTDHHLFALEKPVKAEKLRAKWGEFPLTERDIAAVFVKYVKGEVDCLPWVDEALALETQEILDSLIFLNAEGFLTTNSQPRVNGRPSNDTSVGWGYKGGYVYQKAYIEFFVSADGLEDLARVLPNHESLVYHAVNARGETRTNNEEGTVTAVTWGVFPKREIVQPTVVDPVSFLDWKDEAFRLWLSKWQVIYPAGTPSHSLIARVHQSYWLVNIVDNNFVDGDIFAVFREAVQRRNQPLTLRPQQQKPPTPAPILIAAPTFAQGVKEAVSPTLGLTRAPFVPRGADDALDPSLSPRRVPKAMPIRTDKAPSSESPVMSWDAHRPPHAAAPVTENEDDPAVLQAALLEASAAGAAGIDSGVRGSAVAPHAPISRTTERILIAATAAAVVLVAVAIRSRVSH